MSEPKFRSLRVRLLLPLLAASLLAAMIVAAMSAWLGSQWARQNVDQRFRAVERTLNSATFPLTTSVLKWLADLTQTELITFRENWNGEPIETTLSIDSMGISQLRSSLARQPLHNRDQQGLLLRIGERLYLAFTFLRQNEPAQFDAGRYVLVLFDEEQVRAGRWRAASLPLITGLSTILLLGTLSLYLTDRLIGRLKKLQQRVGFVANGNFDSGERDNVKDEVGGLANAVDAMAAQLKNLWSAVQRQQSEKLLHQIAGGMAHQLRNSLTGARMALELHSRKSSADNNEGLSIALHEIEQAEDYIRRILLVGQGQQDRDRKAKVIDCLRSVQSSLSTVAQHRRVDLIWDLNAYIANYSIKDGPTLVMAITNLTLNAMQAGTIVSVASELVDNERLCISVSDNGTGVPAEIAATIFEPFVTSRPEGMGLGLPLVRRAAEHLDGHVEWCRLNGQTQFRFFATVTNGK